MTTLRRWWRAFTAWLHNHNDDDCTACLDMEIHGYKLATRDQKARQERSR